MGWLPIVAILLVAFAVRFPALPQKGIVDWDEAEYLSHARLVASGARAALSHVGLHLPEGQFLRPQADFEGETRWGKLRGWPNMHHRPAHALSLAVGLLLLGEYPWAGQAVTASFGLLTVAVVYALIKRPWGLGPAILAAAALAVSGWHTLNSAIALPDIAVVLCWALALHTYWRALSPGGFRRHSLAAGALLGLGVTFNERTLLFIPWLVGSEVLLWLRDWLRRDTPDSRSPFGAARAGLARALLVFAGCALLVGAVIGSLGLIQNVTSLLGAPVPGLPWNYVQNISGQFAGWSAFGGGPALKLPSPSPLLIFPYLTWQWDAAPAIALAVAGLATAITLGRREDPSVLLLLLVHYAFFAVSPFHVAHYYLPIALAMSVLAGRWLLVTPATPRVQKLVAVAFAAVVLLAGAPRAAALAAVPSGYQAAAEMAIRETGGKNISNHWSITAYYTGMANTRWPQGGMAAVREAVAEGYWLALVASAHESAGQLAPWEQEPDLAGARLVAVIPNPAGGFLANIHGSAPPSLEEVLEKAQVASPEIRIYDLRPLLGEPRR